MKKFIFSSFLIFSSIPSVFAIEFPDFSKIPKRPFPHQPLVLSNEEKALIRQRSSQDGLEIHLESELAFHGIQEVISLAGYNVEYRRTKTGDTDLPNRIGEILGGKTKTLVLLPVTSVTPFINGLTIEAINSLKSVGSLDPSNQFAMVIPRDRILEDLPKVPPGVQVYIYNRQPGMASSGTNQFLIEATNRGIPAGVAVLEGNRQVFKDVIELFPYAASQIREGVKPIQLDLYCVRGFQPKDKNEIDGWRASFVLAELFVAFPSLRIPQVSIQLFKVKSDRLRRDFKFVKDDNWLASKRSLFTNVWPFRYHALLLNEMAKKDLVSPPLPQERQSVASANAPEVALKVLKEAMEVPGSRSLTRFGSLQYAALELQNEVTYLRPALDSYEKFRGPLEK